MRVGPPDDLKSIPEHLLGPAQKRTRVRRIHKNCLDPAENREQPHQNRTRRHPVLKAGGVDDHREQEALCIDGDVPLAALDLLAGVIAPLRAFATVFTDCESMIATLG